eukprot:6536712-Pyramimonas_sp.AAC.2
MECASFTACGSLGNKEEVSNGNIAVCRGAACLFPEDGAVPRRRQPPPRQNQRSRSRLRFVSRWTSALLSSALAPLPATTAALFETSFLKFVLFRARGSPPTAPIPTKAIL